MLLVLIPSVYQITWSTHHLPSRRLSQKYHTLGGAACNVEKIQSEVEVDFYFNTPHPHHQETIAC